ncbi:MAG TPA: HU family DNA-binding protein [Ktedonobacterales bacterium]|nr:HU family DNA-binding protein [Ktedonobacterales bacterium]
MGTIGKQELIKRVATKAGKSVKETTDLINAALETIRESLEGGDDVRMVGFGAFSVRETAARTGVNPQTREKIQVPARKRVKFTPGKELNDAVTAKHKGHHATHTAAHTPAKKPAK